MIGDRVTWRHRNEDGTPIVAAAGTVAAYAHSATRGFVALVLQADGTYAEAETKNLVATDGPVTSEVTTSEEIERLFQGVRARLAEFDLLDNSEATVPAVMRVLGELRGLVNEQGRELQAEAGLRDSMRKRLGELGLPIEPDENPIIATGRLLGDLRDELLGIAGQLEGVIAERDAALRETDRLGKELEAATTKKGKRGVKPAAPGNGSSSTE